jgi:hypothetical protein
MQKNIKIAIFFPFQLEAATKFNQSNPSWLFPGPNQDTLPTFLI